MSAFYFQFSICRITLTFPSTLKTFILFVTVAMLSGYHLLITAGVETQRTTVRTKWITVTTVIFPGLLYSHLKAWTACLLKGWRGGGIHKTVYFLENYIGTDDCQCRHIRGACSSGCRTKQGKTTRALWGIGLVESSWNVMARGDAREGKWRGNWRMVWVASTLHPTSEHGVSSYRWCAHLGCQ